MGRLHPLRFYQNNAINTTLSLIVKEAMRKIMVWLATGGGKTAIMGEITARSVEKGNMILTIVKRRDVVIQTRDSYKKGYGIDSSFIMGNSKGFDPDKLSQIISSDTMPRRLKNKKFQFLKDASTVIVDECFPRSTFVETSSGWRSIGSLYDSQKKYEELPSVNTYNKNTDSFEFKKIIMVYRNSKRDRLILIKAGMVGIESTENHKFMTPYDGFVEADKLETGDAICLSAHTSRTVRIMNDVQTDVFVGSFFGDGSVQKIKDNVYRLRVRHDKKSQGKYCEFKASLFSSKTRTSINKGFSSNEQVDFNSLSYYIKTDNIFEYCLERLNERSLAIFCMDDGSTSSKKQFSLHTENFNYDENKKIAKRISELIGVEPDVREYYKKDRGRYYNFLMFNKGKKEPLMNYVKNYIHDNCKYKFNVKTCNRFKFEDDINFGVLPISKISYKKINASYMYDLNVEDNHNYIVSRSNNSGKNKDGTQSKKSGIIVHNCHDFTAPGYKKIVWWLEGYNPDLFNEKDFDKIKDSFKKIYLGFTATPHRVGKKTHTYWDGVVKPIEMHELRDLGYLVPIKVYAPKKIDTTGLRIDKGDFNNKQLFERVSKLEVIGDTVNLYLKYANDKPAIIFCVNRDHSKMVAEALRRAGVPAIHCDGEHGEDERNEAIEGMKRGKYKVLVNCGIWTTGFDLPMIEVMIGARPTESENLYRQMVGRVLRPYKICAKCNTHLGGVDECYICKSTEFSYVKKEAILIDQGNNVSRFGMPYDVAVAELTPEDTAAKKAQLKTGVKDCPVCFLTMHNTERNCPSCGFDFAKKKNEREVNHVDGELYEVDENFLMNQKLMRISDRYNQLMRVEMTRNMAWVWKYYKLYDEFGEDLIPHYEKMGMCRATVARVRLNQLYKGVDDLVNGTKKIENARIYK